jgi:DME family drug/metabolite transporter
VNVANIIRQFIASESPVTYSGADRAGLLVGLLACLAWGMTGPLIHLVTTASAGTVTVCRLVLSAGSLFLIALVRRRRQAAAAPNIAVASMAAYYVFATEAFTRAPVVEVTLLVGSAPLIAVCLDWLKGRRVGGVRLLGVAIAVVGLATFVLPGSMHSKTSMAGDVLALAAATVSALYVTQLRAAALAGRSPDAVGIAMRASVIGAIAAAALAGARGTLSATGITAHDWIMLILLGTFSTAVPTVAYSVASRRLPATVTTSLSLLTPIFAAIFAGLLLGQWPALIRLPGAVLSLLGIGIVVLSKERNSQAAGVRVPR